MAAGCKTSRIYPENGMIRFFCFRVRPWRILLFCMILKNILCTFLYNYREIGARIKAFEFGKHNAESGMAKLRAEAFLHRGGGSYLDL